jgi:hypothetical protein
MKKLRLSILLTAFLACSPLFAASEYSISWTWAGVHQTTNTTWSPIASSCVINTLIMNVSGAGTTWAITVKEHGGSGRILWTGTATLGTTTILAAPVGIQMTGGIDVTFSGTAGVADFFATYR